MRLTLNCLMEASQEKCHTSRRTNGEFKIIKFIGLLDRSYGDKIQTSIKRTQKSCLWDQGRPAGMMGTVQQAGTEVPGRHQAWFCKHHRKDISWNAGLFGEQAVIDRRRLMESCSQQVSVLWPVKATASFPGTLSTEPDRKRSGYVCWVWGPELKILIEPQIQRSKGYYYSPT